MEVVTGTEIRDFKIRGGYFNSRSLLLRRDLHSKKQDLRLASPGYSPPVVEYELSDGTKASMPVSECDIPFLCQGDAEMAKHYLSLVLDARHGDSQSAKQLSRKHGDEKGELLQPTESSFVVPCTSSQPHSEQAISHKAFILLKLCRLGYPVPDFVVLTSQAYTERAHGLEAHLADALQQLEILTTQWLGADDDPLVFAIRCATGHYIPGVMDTYLNVGVTTKTLPALERKYGRIAARKMFLNNLRNLCHLLDPEENATFVDAVRHDLSPATIDALVERLTEVVAKTDESLIKDPFAQAFFFSKQAYKHFQENQELVVTLCRGTEHYPSLILQKMICTVRHESAYAGVISSRHTQTGTGIELQTAHNIFGEEMMTGLAEIQTTNFEDHEAIKDSFPGAYHFIPHLRALEIEFESPVTIEFAVEATERYQWFALLQLNETAMAGRAAFLAVVDMHKSGVISRQRVTELIRPYHVKQLTSDTIDQEVFDALQRFCIGVSVLPRSAVSAQLYFSSEAALKAKSMGQRVCLCKTTFVPTDTVVMREMDAIVSLTSAAIHVVTICQSLGIPALLSLEQGGVHMRQRDALVNSQGREIHEGDWITLSSRRRSLYEGQAKFVPGRLLRFIKGEPVQLEKDEQKAFLEIAYAYRYYRQLIKDVEVDQVSTLGEVTRLVNFEMRGEADQAKRLVNAWFDDREMQYTEGVLKSDIGDHLGQSSVFEMLTLDRKIRFFKLALTKCAREQISGYEAGAFMLGRFLCMRYPAAFWKAFTPAEIGLLVNEWVLFEKYMQVLHNVGERKLLLARKQILKGGLEQLSLHPGNVQPLITLKLSSVRLDEARALLPEWADPQSAKVLELLQQPYRAFYDFKAPWSRGQFEKICQEEKLLMPGPNDA